MKVKGDPECEKALVCKRNKTSKVAVVYEESREWAVLNRDRNEKSESITSDPV